MTDQQWIEVNQNQKIEETDENLENKEIEESSNNNKIVLIIGCILIFIFILIGAVNTKNYNNSQPPVIQVGDTQGPK